MSLAFDKLQSDYYQIRLHELRVDLWFLKQREVAAVQQSDHALACTIRTEIEGAKARYNQTKNTFIKMTEKPDR